MDYMLRKVIKNALNRKGVYDDDIISYVFLRVVEYLEM